MHVSLSLVRAVEQGRAPASSSFVAAAARALSLTVYDLYDQPTPRFGEECSGLSELETAIMVGPGLAADIPAVSLAEFENRVRAISALHQRSRYDQSAVEMPDLLADLHAAAATMTGDRDIEQAHKLLARTYGAAVICLYRLGSPLAGQAAERAAAAAQLSGDPLLAALADAEVGLPLMRREAYAPAKRLTDRARDSIREIRDSPEAWSIHGYLHLRSAILAARRGDQSGTDEHLMEARDYGSRVGELADYYDTAFSGANVAIHSVAAAVELGDGTTAQPGSTAAGRDDALVSVTTTSTWRARGLHGDREKAFASLLKARSFAPHLTGYHPQVRETLVVLAESDRRRTDSLTGFARLAGVSL